VIVGGVEVTPVLGAIGLLGPYAQLYPDVPAEAWAPYRERYPELFAGDAWRLPCASLLLRSGGITVLVDTGVGRPGLCDWEPEVEGRLVEEVDPADVDIVFLTHPNRATAARADAPAPFCRDRPRAPAGAARRGSVGSAHGVAPR